MFKTRAEVDDVMDGSPNEYEVTEKWMTPKEFESLPEHMGW